MNFLLLTWKSCCNRFHFKVFQIIGQQDSIKKNYSNFANSIHLLVRPIFPTSFPLKHKTQNIKFSYHILILKLSCLSVYVSKVRRSRASPGRNSWAPKVDSESKFCHSNTWPLYSRSSSGVSSSQIWGVKSGCQGQSPGQGPTAAQLSCKSHHSHSQGLTQISYWPAPHSWMLQDQEDKVQRVEKSVSSMLLS